MVSRAIIVERSLDGCKYKVRIPILDGIGADSLNPSATDDNLRWASVLCIPGIDVEYEEGDIVIVAFEDEASEAYTFDYPIILGYLKLRGTDMESRVSGYFRILEASDSFTAPSNTTIGATTYEKINAAMDDVEELVEERERGITRVSSSFYKA